MKKKQKSSEDGREKFFKCRLKIVRDSAFRIGVGSSFHQPGTVNENDLERDFMPLCDGTISRHSLTDLRLLERKIVISEWK